MFRRLYLRALRRALRHEAESYVARPRPATAPPRDAWGLTVYELDKWLADRIAESAARPARWERRR